MEIAQEFRGWGLCIVFGVLDVFECHSIISTLDGLEEFVW